MLKLFFIFFVIFLFGCSSASKKSKPPENPREVQKAVGSIMDNVSGKKTVVKYCPLCGRHYAAPIEICPHDGAKLQEVQE